MRSNELTYHKGVKLFGDYWLDFFRKCSPSVDRFIGESFYLYSIISTPADIF